jgi:hypothetical protein
MARSSTRDAGTVPTKLDGWGEACGGIVEGVGG